MRTARTAKTDLLFWLTLLLGNLLIWLPVLFSAFPTIGLGHDSQIFTAAIHNALRNGNVPWEPMTKILAAREDIFSYPYFGLLYPFYFTLGFTDQFDYAQSLFLDFCSVVFHMVVASITFGLLLKKMGCNILIAATYGLLYAYCLHLKLWSSWIWALSGYTWIPLCIAGIWIVVVNKDHLRGIILLATGFGFTSLGTGLPLIYGFLLAGAMFLGCLLYTRTTPKSDPKVFLSVLSGGVVAFCIGASNLIPSLYRSSEYIRWYSGGSIEGGFKPPYEGTLAAVLEFSPEVITKLFVPIGWSGLGHVYLGCGVVVFALYFVVHNYRKSFTWPLVALALYFLLDAFGDATFIHRITYQLPLLGSIRYPLANVFIPLFVVLLFSALGATQLINTTRGNDSRYAHRWLVFVALMCISSVIVQYLYRDSLIGGFSGTHRWLLYLPAAVSIVFLLVQLRPTFSLGKYFPVILMATYAAQGSMLFHPKIPQKNGLYLSCPAFMDLYDGLRQAGREQDIQGRLAVMVSPKFPKNLDNCLRRFKLNSSLLESVILMAGWDVNQIYQSPRPVKEFKLMARFARRLPEPDAAYQAGITHLLTDTEIPGDSPENGLWALLGNFSGLYLYGIDNPGNGLTSLGCVSSQQTPSQYLFSGTGGARTININKNHLNINQISCASGDQNASAGLRYKISQLGRTSSKIRYQAHLDRPGLFLTDQVFNPNWMGDYDGNEIEFFQADGYRLAASLPAGDYQITLKYRPFDFTIGIYLSYLGMLVLLILVLFSRKHMKTEKSRFLNVI